MSETFIAKTASAGCLIELLDNDFTLETRNLYVATLINERYFAGLLIILNAWLSKLCMSVVFITITVLASSSIKRALILIFTFEIKNLYVPILIWRACAAGCFNHIYSRQVINLCSVYAVIKKSAATFTDLHY